MAGYFRLGDDASSRRGMSEQIRRRRTRRPQNWHVPGPTWTFLGEVPVAIIPALFVPIASGEYPEYKQIVAVHGRIESGSATVNWFNAEDFFHTGHEVTVAGPNRVELEHPFIIDGDDGGEWIGPEITESDGGVTLSLSIIVEIVPI
jgi:hypothetical protein